MTALTAIQGLSPSVARRLESEGVTSVEELLDQGATTRGRAALAAVSRIPAARLLGLVQQADLFRVGGVAGEMAALLHDVGVAGVPELARRDPDQLAGALAEANARRPLVRRAPSAAVVAGWVREAARLPKIVVG